MYGLVYTELLKCQGQMHAKLTILHSLDTHIQSPICICGICVYVSTYVCILGNRVARTINLLSPTEYGSEPVLAGPAQFGPDFSPEAALEGPLAVAHPFDLCQSIRSDKVDIVKHIVLIQRGGCSFMTKVGVTSYQLIVYLHVMNEYLFGIRR